MFQHQGIWLPDGERHFPEWMSKNGEIIDGKGTYQIRKLRAALQWVRGWDVAVDVGAHVGLWSMRLAERFENVIAFEPVATFRECFAKNAWMRGVKCFPYALGAAPGRVALETPRLGAGIDTGGTHVCGSGDVDMRTLDSFELERVDFLKVDCEGYEGEVLKGAVDTLARCHPCVIVEQKARCLHDNFGLSGTPAVQLLESLGARVRGELSGDFILSWD